MDTQTQQASPSTSQAQPLLGYQQSLLDNQRANLEVSEPFAPIGISSLLDDFQYTSSPSSLTTKYADSGPIWLRKDRFNSRLLLLVDSASPSSTGRVQ